MPSEPIRRISSPPAADRRSGDSCSTGRLRQRLDLVELGANHVVAVVERHVARDAVVVKPHPQLVIWLVRLGIGGEESQANPPGRPLDQWALQSPVLVLAAGRGLVALGGRIDAR